MTHKYLFILGRTPELGVAELQRFFPTVSPISTEVIRVESDTIEAKSLIEGLGGTVKIAREVGIVSELTGDSLVGFLPTAPEVHFGLSMYGGTIPGALLGQIKDLLEKKGVRTRYASPRHGETLSSVTVDKKHLSELVLIKTKEGFVVGLTEAVQAYESWNERDYGRPYADAKVGMLPPKVSRMLANIARPDAAAISSSFDGVLLDPFCGMGTVLSEAYLSGWKVMGCDISEENVRKTNANLEWTTKLSSSQKGHIDKIFVCDAVHVADVIPKNSINAIVTEPFMGATSIANKSYAQPQEIKNIIKGLEKLYIGCLREWAKILVSGGIVIIALPEYAVGGRTYFVKKVIDMCEILGYTIENGPIGYSRPQATVRRMFYVLRKK
jgi:tRNA G10  N-methylase Trm11